jgi:ribonuclease D
LLIKKSSELIEFIDLLGEPPYIAIDTEFIPENTYFPQLCLIQIAYGEHQAVIDTLANIDLNPLVSLLINPKIVKVFHAGDQDLAIFWNTFKQIPSPVFDTQIAAMVCGFGDQVSYSKLVKAITNNTLDKSSQIVDWSKRPLMAQHVNYAIADVTHLCVVYEYLLKDIKDRNRDSWVVEEMNELVDIKRYEFNPDIQIKKIKLKGASPRRLAILRELVVWRDEEARLKNHPRTWILKDNSLRDIASNPPHNIETLARIRGIGGIATGKSGKKILECIQSAKQLPIEKCPIYDDFKNGEYANSEVVALLNALLKSICEKNDMAARLVATKSDIEKFVLGDPTKVAKGWRWNLFGKQASRLLQGKIALTVRDNNIDIVNLNE